MADTQLTIEIDISDARRQIEALGAEFEKSGQSIEKGAAAATPAVEKLEQEMAKVRPLDALAVDSVGKLAAEMQTLGNTNIANATEQLQKLDETLASVSNKQAPLAQVGESMQQASVGASALGQHGPKLAETANSMGLMAKAGEGLKLMGGILGDVAAMAIGTVAALLPLHRVLEGIEKVAPGIVEVFAVAGFAKLGIEAAQAADHVERFGRAFSALSPDVHAGAQALHDVEQAAEASRMPLEGMMQAYKLIGPSVIAAGKSSQEAGKFFQDMAVGVRNVGGSMNQVTAFAQIFTRALDQGSVPARSLRQILPTLSASMMGMSDSLKAAFTNGKITANQLVELVEVMNKAKPATDTLVEAWGLVTSALHKVFAEGGAAETAFNPLINSIKHLADTLTTSANAQEAFSNLMRAFAIVATVVITAADGVIRILGLWDAACRKLGEGIGWLVGLIAGGWVNAFQVVMEGMQNTWDILVGIGDYISSAVSSVWNAMPEWLTGPLAAAFAKAIEWITLFWEKLKAVFKFIADITGISTLIEALKSTGTAFEESGNKASKTTGDFGKFTAAAEKSKHATAEHIPHSKALGQAMGSAGEQAREAGVGFTSYGVTITRATDLTKKAAEATKDIAEPFKDLAGTVLDAGDKMKDIGTGLTDADLAFKAFAVDIPPAIENLKDLGGSATSLVYVKEAAEKLQGTIIEIPPSVDKLKSSFDSLRDTSTMFGSSIDLLVKDSQAVGDAFNSEARAATALGSEYERLTQQANTLDQAQDKLDANGNSGGGGGGTTEVQQNRSGGLVGSSVDPLVTVPSKVFEHAPRFAEGTPNTSAFMGGGSAMAAVVHRSEAIVPLSGGRNIPVEIRTLGKNEDIHPSVHILVKSMDRLVQTMTGVSGLPNNAFAPIKLVDGPSQRRLHGSDHRKAHPLKSLVDMTGDPIDGVTGGMSGDGGPTMPMAPKLIQPTITVHMHGGRFDSFKLTSDQIAGAAQKALDKVKRQNT